MIEIVDNNKKRWSSYVEGRFFKYLDPISNVDSLTVELDLGIAGLVVSNRTVDVVANANKTIVYVFQVRLPNH